MDEGRIEPRQMLCLAALTYGEFADVAFGVLHDRQLRADVEDKLARLPPLGARWELVWGPASYRAPFSPVDTSAMFVVRDRQRPCRYVVAVRGTNPISAFDWWLGDFWVVGQVPWPLAEPDPARISLSTALGLDTLLQLRSRPPGTPGGRAVAFEDLQDAWWRAVVQPPAGVQPAAARSVRMTRALADRTGRGQAFAATWPEAARQAFETAVAGGCAAVVNHTSQRLLGLLREHARVAAAVHDGSTLTAFLRARAAAAPDYPLEVIVTGHSKGGALAPALALWLHETRNDSAAAGPGWSPAAAATVRSIAFAGPTPGNAAFAARVEQALPDAVRVVNPLDVVPHAWVPADLGRIPTLYGPAVPAPWGLETMAKTVANAIETQALGYAHAPGAATELEARPAADARTFVEHMIHQHLQGYLDAMGVGSDGDGLDVTTFFFPLPRRPRSGPIPKGGPS